MIRIRTLIAAAAIAFSGATAQAQLAPGDDILINGGFDYYTVVMNGNTGGVLYYVPTEIQCQNYPRLNKACGYDHIAGTVSILSAKSGLTQTARMVWPITPSWSKPVWVPVAGVYTFSITITKVRQADVINEPPLLKVVVNDGLTPLLSVPHVDLPVGVPTTRSVTVPLTAGAHTLYIKLSQNVVPTSYGNYGFLYKFNGATLTYAGY